MSYEMNLKKKAAIISLIIGIGMFLGKTTAYLLTNSAAIFSDAAESVVHVLATSMALFSIYLSSKPADKTHLYGHGNIEYFSAGTEGLLIVIAAIVIIYTAVLEIVNGSNLKQLDIGVAIVAAAGGINLFLGIYLVRTGKNTNSLTLVADGKHVLTDSYTSIGVLIGIILVMSTGFELLDPFFAIAVAVNIIFTGYKLVRESVGGLMNETHPETLQKISDQLIKFKKDYWIDLHELRFWRSGDKMFTDFHLILPWYFTIQQSHTEENEIEDLLLKEFPNTQLKIHFDFCIPELCKFCGFKSCNVRTEDKSENFEWDVSKLTGEPVYRIQPLPHSETKINKKQKQ
jgi:cation diffusion facilitator family transporter